MFKILKSKLDSWSHSKLAGHAGYLPMAPLGDRNVGFYDNDANSLHIIKKYKVISYNNDNTIAIMINLKSVNSTDNDFNTMQRLFEKGFNIIEPIETKTENKLQYALYKSPNNQIGIPFTAEYFINKSFDSAFLEQFITEIATFIQLLSELQCYYPERFVGVENRLKNDIGYYYFNIINFNVTKEEFIDMQLQYFQYVLDNPVFESIDKVKLFDQARQKWQQ